MKMLVDSSILRVVLPSHMRVSATKLVSVGDRIKLVVLPSHMRVSATDQSWDSILKSLCCPTLSYEGVCNQLKINISESRTFYLVCSNHLKYNPHMILSWKLRKYTEKIISIMTIFHVFPHFNSPQPNLNLRK